MLNIRLDEVTNGWLVVVFDLDKGQYLVNEYTETKLEALEVLEYSIKRLKFNEESKLNVN